MRRFKVMVEGRNVIIRLDRRTARMGFFATRLIESNTLASAEKAALDLIRAELMDVLLNARSDPPIFTVDEAFELRADAGADRGLSGFTWYPE